MNSPSVNDLTPGKENDPVLPNEERENLEEDSKYPTKNTQMLFNENYQQLKVAPEQT